MPAGIARYSFTPNCCSSPKRAAAPTSTAAKRIMRSRLTRCGLAFAVVRCPHVCPRISAHRCRVAVLAYAIHGPLVLPIDLLGLLFLFPYQDRERFVFTLFLRESGRGQDA